MARVEGRITIEIDVEADDVLDLLDKMEERTEDMRPVFRWAKAYLETANSANFAANGLPTGQSWKPLSAEYGAWKAANFPGTGMLRQSGRLFRSLTSLSDSTANIISKDTATFGTSVEYAKFHQYGTTKMPKRKIVFTPREFPKELGINMAKYIVLGEDGVI